jgi:hypothetical protein
MIDDNGINSINLPAMEKLQKGQYVLQLVNGREAHSLSFLVD